MTNQELFDELLRTTQVVRKNAMGNEGRWVLDGAFREAYERNPSNEEVERILAKMFPWLFGDSSIMHILTRPHPTGQDLYNALFIAHHADKSGIIVMAFNTYGRYKFPDGLPKPEPQMALLESLDEA